MFNNTKYGNLLTIILIITIIAIFGIVGIVGYRMYKSYVVDTGSTTAATMFEESFQDDSNNIIQNNVNVIGNNIEDNSNFVEIQGIEKQNTSTKTESSGKKVTKYKGFDVIGTIEIPTIKLKYVILEQLTKKSLETSVVLLYTANGLNNAGNSVIIGHNYRNGTMFSNVKNLKKGDAIYITDLEGNKVKYTVYNLYRASGSDGEYITRNTNGKREISLSTCTDDSKARTIVLAKES